MHEDRAKEGLRLGDFLPYQLAIAANAVGGRIAQQYHARFGLKPIEWRMMAVLGDRGEATQRELALASLMDKVAVNRACRALEGRELVERRPHAGDRRSHRLVLTAEGWAMHRRILPLARAMERELLAPFTTEEREELKRLLIRLRESAGAFEPLRLEE